MTSTQSATISKERPAKKVLLFAGLLVASIALTLLIQESTFTIEQSIVLFFSLFSIGLWVTEAAPPFAVALMIIAALVFTLGYEGLVASEKDVRVYTDTLSSSVIWLLLAGFFLAAAMSKTGLDADLIAFSMRVCGTNPRWILLGMMGVAMLASMVMSNATTTVMVISAVMPLVNQLGKESKVGKALILGIPIAATTGGMATLIGSPTNALAAQAATASGQSLNFVRWMAFGVPLALTLTALAWFALVRTLIKTAAPVDSISAPGSGGADQVMNVKRVVVISILIACMALWLTSPLHGLSATAVGALPLVLLPLFGILNASDLRSMGWDTLILIAGGLALGEGLIRSGLMDIYASRISGMGLPPVMLMLGIAYLAVIMSTVMSNSAACAILLALGRLVLPDHFVECAAIVALSSSCALLLPVSTPPNAIAYASGVITQRDFLYGGLPVGLLGPLLSVLWVLAIS